MEPAALILVTVFNMLLVKTGGALALTLIKQSDFICMQVTWSWLLSFTCNGSLKCDLNTSKFLGAMPQTYGCFLCFQDFHNPSWSSHPLVYSLTYSPVSYQLAMPGRAEYCRATHAGASKQTAAFMWLFEFFHYNIFLPVVVKKCMYSISVKYICTALV